LVAESEDENAGLDLFGREQVEAAGLLPELDLCSGCGCERDIGQSIAKSGVARLIEGGEPAIEEAAGWCVGDEAHLIAKAGQANEDGGVNGADVVALASGYGSVGGIAEDDGVDLRWIVFLVGSRGVSRCGVGRTSGVAGGEKRVSGVSQGIDDRGEGTDGG
jgi:hypothetical protein